MSAARCPGRLRGKAGSASDLPPDCSCPFDNCLCRSNFPWTGLSATTRVRHQSVRQTTRKVPFVPRTSRLSEVGELPSALAFATRSVRDDARKWRCLSRVLPDAFFFGAGEGADEPVLSGLPVVEPIPGVAAGASGGRRGPGPPAASARLPGRMWRGRGRSDGFVRRDCGGPEIEERKKRSP